MLFDLAQGGGCLRVRVGGEAKPRGVGERRPQDRLNPLQYGDPGASHLLKLPLEKKVFLEVDAGLERRKKYTQHKI